MKRVRNTIPMVLLGFIGLMIVGCLPFPLGDPSQAKVDPKLVGFWCDDAEDLRNVIVMYPFDEHCYVVQSQNIKKEDDKWVRQGNPLIMKGWITEIEGKRILCTEPLMQKIKGEDDKKFYPAMQLETTDKGLRMRMIDSDFEPLKTVKNAAEELAVVTREINNPKLFTDRPSDFHRLDKDRDSATIDLAVEH